MAKNIQEQWRVFFRSRGDELPGGLMDMLSFFVMFDADNNGELDAFEFVTMCRKLSTIYSEDIEGEEPSAAHKIIFSDAAVARFFRAVDTDRSGFITKKELLEAIRGRPPPFRQACIDFMFNSIDTNGNGVIEFSEAVAFYKTHEMKTGKIGRAGESVKVLPSSKKGRSSKKFIDNADARRFIDFFDRDYNKAGKIDVTVDDIHDDGEGNAKVQVSRDSDRRGSQIIARDGKISRLEFGLYWANRSFYQPLDDAFVREFETDFGFDLTEAAAHEEVMAMAKKLEELEKAQTLGMGQTEATSAASAEDENEDVVLDAAARRRAAEAVAGALGHSPTAPTSPKPSAGVAEAATSETRASGKYGRTGRMSVQVQRGSEVSLMAMKVKELQEELAKQSVRARKDIEERDLLVEQLRQANERLTARVQDLELQVAL